MSNYLSRAELDEISNGLIEVYVKQHPKKAVQSMDIEHFITEFLMLKIEYASFAEDDCGKVGFTADGEIPLLIYSGGEIIPFVFPKKTIVLDKFLLAEKEYGRRRFTMAHEAAHHILRKMQLTQDTARFHSEYDKERAYSKEEVLQMFHSAEWQADTMAASLLMPRFLVENAMNRFADSKPIKIYGDTTFTAGDKAVMRNMANYLGVSYTALVIRLTHLNMLEKHDICDYISQELKLGGM